MIRRHLIWTTLAMLLTVAPSVAAQEGTGEVTAEKDRDASRDSAREKLTVKAEQLFNQGKYDEALDVLGRAYAIGKDPKTLYNIARVYEEKGDLEKAIEYYDQFIVAPNVALENRKLAMKRARSLRGEREEQRQAAVVNETDTARKQPDDEGSSSQPEEGLPEAALGPPPAAPAQPPVFVPVVQRTDNREAWRRVGIGFTAVGVATVATGGVLGALSLKARNDFEAQTDLEAARQDADRANRLAVMADAFYISGAVLGLSGLVIAITSWGQSADSNDAQALELQVGANRVNATWRF